MKQIVQVKFNRGPKNWTQPYTYFSDIEVKERQIVLVPSHDFYSVGKVWRILKESEFTPNPEIEYKYISHVVKL